MISNGSAEMSHTITHSERLYDVASWPLKDSFSTRQGWQKGLNNKTGTHKLLKEISREKRWLIQHMQRVSCSSHQNHLCVFKVRLVLLPNPGESKKYISVFYPYTNNSSHDHRAPSSNMEKRRTLGLAWPSSLFQTFLKK